MQALRGVRVLEFGGLASVPYCGLLLSDFGADVIRVDKPGPKGPTDLFLARGKRSIQLDLKSPASMNVLKHVIPQMDVLIDPYRPGVMEKLGLGPERACKWNKRLIYARLTGYGQTGPLAKAAGHDINYLAIAGTLSTIQRRNEKPLAPVNYLADFAGGGLFCAYGIMVALYERTISGKGQVIDAAMIDGVSHLTTFVHKFHASGHWDVNHPGSNILDSGAPFYDTYETKDGKYMAVGAIEPQFYQSMVDVLGLVDLPYQMDRSSWPTMKDRITAAFKSKTQQEWTDAFQDVDACVTPVLPLTQIMEHPHNAQRLAMVQPSDPAPAPRLSRTPGQFPADVSTNGKDTADVLQELNVPRNLIAQLPTSKL